MHFVFSFTLNSFIFLLRILQKNQANLLKTKSMPTKSKSTQEDEKVKEEEQKVFTASQVKTWGVNEVVEYIQSHGKLNASTITCNMFRENQIDGSTLLALTYEDLTDDLSIEDESFIRALLVLISDMHQN
jgi:NAD-dependent DNA ligase